MLPAPNPPAPHCAPASFRQRVIPPLPYSLAPHCAHVSFCSPTVLPAPHSHRSCRPRRALCAPRLVPPVSHSAAAPHSARASFRSRLVRPLPHSARADLPAPHSVPRLIPPPPHSNPAHALFSYKAFVSPSSRIFSSVPDARSSTPRAPLQYRLLAVVPLLDPSPPP